MLATILDDIIFSEPPHKVGSSRYRCWYPGNLQHWKKSYECILLPWVQHIRFVCSPVLPSPGTRPGSLVSPAYLRGAHAGGDVAEDGEYDQTWSVETGEDCESSKGFLHKSPAILPNSIAATGNGNSSDPSFSLLSISKSTCTPRCQAGSFSAGSGISIDVNSICQFFIAK